jgi:chitodextrinase
MDNVGVTMYTVFRNGVAVANPTSTTFTDAGLAQGTSYSYTVSASDARNNTSVASGAVVVATRADDVKPSVPGAARSTVTGSYLVTTTWSASSDTGGSGLAGYRVFRSDNATTPLAVVKPTVTSYADTLVKAKTTYTYKVVAIDGRGNQSAAGAGNTVTTAAAKETVKPTTPTNVHVVSRAATSITFAWTASKDAGGVKGYHIYRKGVYVADATGTTFTDSGLTPSTSLSYTVVAFDSSANVSSSSAVLTTSTTA